MPYISICIPTYEMNGKGALFLEHSLGNIAKQVEKDFEVIVSDHSTDDTIAKTCDKFKDKFELRYYRNEEKRGSSSANTNYAMRLAKGKLIKILFQDDFLYGMFSLTHIKNNFDLTRYSWMITACNRSYDGITSRHPFYPVYNGTVSPRKNTLGPPSVLTIKNENHLEFDENLVWLMDCDYYKRCHDRFGPPKLYPVVNVSVGIGVHQVTNTIADKKRRVKENLYVMWKYLRGNTLL